MLTTGPCMVAPQPPPYWPPWAQPYSWSAPPPPQVTAPFLIPEMVDRLAGMLNYFLKYLTGSERRRLAIRDPEKYSFKLRELLLSIIQVRRGGGGTGGERAMSVSLALHPGWGGYSSAHHL